jgi:hypothetical protein
VAQEIRESQRLDAAELLQGSLVDARFGSDLAAETTDERYLVVGADGGEARAMRLREEDTGWKRLTLISTFTPGGAATAAGAGDAIASINEFVRPLAPLGTALAELDSRPEALARIPGMFAAGMPTHGANSGRVVTYRFNDELSVWLPDPPIDWPFGAASEAFFGYSVVLDPAGSLLVVGAPMGDSVGPNGIVFVYERLGGAWAHKQSIYPPSEYDTLTGSFFGGSLDLLDGWLVVGAPFADKIISGVGAPADDVGAVFLYRASVNDFFLAEAIFQDVQDDDRLGTSVALGRRGSGGYVLVAGVPGDDSSAVDGGGAKTFRLDASDTWRPSERYAASDARQADAFGSAVAIDGLRVYVGAPERDQCPRGVDCARSDLEPYTSSTMPSSSMISSRATPRCGNEAASPHRKDRREVRFRPGSLRSARTIAPPPSVPGPCPLLRVDPRAAALAVHGSARPR